MLLFETGYNTSLASHLRSRLLSNFVYVEEMPLAIKEAYLAGNTSYLQGVEGVLEVDRGSNAEWISFKGVDYPNKAFLGTNRGLKRNATTETDIDYANILEHKQGAAVTLVFHSLNMARVWAYYAGSGTCAAPIPAPIPSSYVLTSPLNAAGNCITNLPNTPCDGTSAVNQNYVNTQLASLVIPTGVILPATTTQQGIVKLATNAQINSRTSSLSGYPLVVPADSANVPNNDTTAALAGTQGVPNSANKFVTDNDTVNSNTTSEHGDDNRIARVLASTGKINIFRTNQIQWREAGENILADQFVYISNDGKAYVTFADDPSQPAVTRWSGAALATTTIGNRVPIQTEGVVTLSSVSGTIGDPVFLDGTTATKGTIGTKPVDSRVIVPVGIKQSGTEVLLQHSGATIHGSTATLGNYTIRSSVNTTNFKFASNGLATQTLPPGASEQLSFNMTTAPLNGALPLSLHPNNITSSDVEFIGDIAAYLTAPLVAPITQWEMAAELFLDSGTNLTGPFFALTPSFSGGQFWGNQSAPANATNSVRIHERLGLSLGLGGTCNLLIKLWVKNVSTGAATFTIGDVHWNYRLISHF